MTTDEKHALTAIDALMDGLDAIIDGRIDPLSLEFALKVRDVMAERGWAIVPVEPTEAMLGEGERAVDPYSHPAFSDYSALQVWRAMVEAAGR